MALTISIELTDDQHAFIRQLADVMSPGMTDADIVAMLEQRIREEARDWAVRQLDANEGEQARAAVARVRQQVVQAKRTAQLLFATEEV